MRTITSRAVLNLVAVFLMVAARPLAAQLTQVQTTEGVVRGTVDGGATIGIFRGVPFAAPPVGNLRWRAPQPHAKWSDVRDATHFGAQCTQPPQGPTGRAIYGDETNVLSMSEDCLTLNIWTPAKRANEKLPVMVWIHGGGLDVGTGAKAIFSGEGLAGKGVVLVTINYRLGVLGFFAHPELTAESPAHVSGNYGLLDQVEALKWIQRNIAAFGGNPANVTIFGASAGAYSVSALMVVPQARGLFHKAIGESSGFAPSIPTLAEAEKAGKSIEAAVHVSSLAALRSLPADSLIRVRPPGYTTDLAVDGNIIPRNIADIYREGRQAHIPLLAGWNADEWRPYVTLARVQPTLASVKEATRAKYGVNTDAVLAAYGVKDEQGILEAAAALTSDEVIGYDNWKWVEQHRATGGAPVYRYLFARKSPVAAGKMLNGIAVTTANMGARHGAETQYVFGTFGDDVAWEPGDRALSDLIMRYWSNFARSGDPNGANLPVWPRFDRGRQVMELDVRSAAGPERWRERYEMLDRAILKKQ